MIRFRYRSAIAAMFWGVFLRSMVPVPRLETWFDLGLAVLGQLLLILGTISFLFSDDKGV